VTNTASDPLVDERGAERGLDICGRHDGDDTTSQ
jgi:hypothetical protein